VITHRRIQTADRVLFLSPGSLLPRRQPLALLPPFLRFLRLGRYREVAPAVAMQPPAPPRFHHLMPAAVNVYRAVSQRTVMMLRNVAHHPLRAALTTLGMALATGILVVSLFISDSMEHLIDVTYFMADRQDATLSFVEKRPQAVVMQIARLPGILAAEPYRAVPARVRRGSIERRVMISGRPPDADLNRIIDVDLGPVVLPEAGLAISDMLAQIPGVTW
jgi:putative ABC transport system permease protein